MAHVGRRRGPRAVGLARPLGVARRPDRARLHGHAAPARLVPLQLSRGRRGADEGGEALHGRNGGGGGRPRPDIVLVGRGRRRDGDSVEKQCVNSLAGNSKIVGKWFKLTVRLMNFKWQPQLNLRLTCGRSSR